MAMKLTVLAGAKKGTTVPLKKETFVIGRSSECSLRAGSDAISRQHCMIVRTGDGLIVRDLGSRNGTYVNDQRIEADTPLNEGDELRVGPLKFRVQQAEAQLAAQPKAEAAGIKKTKQPPVKDVADVAARSAAAASSDSVYEDDISRWLIDVDIHSTATRETQNIRIDDTASMRRSNAQTVEMPVGKLPEGKLPEGKLPEGKLPEGKQPEGKQPEGKQPEGKQPEGRQPEGQEHPADEPSDAGDATIDSDCHLGNDDDDEAAQKSGSWAIFGRGKSKTTAKQKPGRLPKLPQKEQAKDSREAAAKVLREMTRRR